MRLRNHMLNTESGAEELMELKDAIVELYLAIKIRSTEEVSEHPYYHKAKHFVLLDSWTK